jgi:Resolvase, N terminal domain/Helix-turn-helix domain of resolvase
LAAFSAAFVLSEMRPASSSATDAIVVSMNLPIAPCSSGRSANRTSTPDSIRRLPDARLTRTQAWVGDPPRDCRKISLCVAFRVVDDPTIDTTSGTGKLVMGILALIAEFENDIRRERQMDGITKARDRGVRFGRKPLLVAETIKKVRKLRKAGKTVPEIMRQTSLSKASVYRALSA